MKTSIIKNLRKTYSNILPVYMTIILLHHQFSGMKRVIYVPIKSRNHIKNKLSLKRQEFVVPLFVIVNKSSNPPLYKTVN